jgi:hypothetical protein
VARAALGNEPRDRGALVVWAGYSVLGVAYFFWYMMVPLAGIVALAAVGLPRIVRGRAIYVSAAALLLGVWTLAPKLYLGAPRPSTSTSASSPSTCSRTRARARR